METNFITKHFPEPVLDKIEAILTPIAEKNYFQKAYDWFKGITPNQTVVDVIVLIVKYLFNKELKELAILGYEEAQELQFMIDDKKITPEEAGQSLRGYLNKTAVNYNISISSSIINFLAEAVVLALKVKAIL